MDPEVRRASRGILFANSRAAVWGALFWIACSAAARGQSSQDPAPTPPPSPEKPAGQEPPPRPNPAPGAPGDVPAQNELTLEDWSLHFQATAVSQGHGAFSAKYSGVHSLSDKGENEMSFTSTLFLGRRLWEGGALYLNPEVSGGSGLSGTTGLAAFPNGEITRVSVEKPIPYVARLYLEQTVDLGGADQKVEPGPNQLAGHTSDMHLTLRAGKFSAVDMFDDNKYSHDPREQFLNWALMDNGAWDYPADTRGYTGGLAAELELKEWTLRYGFFLMPKFANGLPIDFTFQDAHGQAIEVDHAHVFLDRPGTLRAMIYINHADMGKYRET
ncbi:MAG TPA: carbohydrate porin, partial [Planctomycetota bacterium]|nr:carbohydrate porin [Planctomycetota bacterium]